MSSLPSQSAVTHNDDHDEQPNPSASTFSTINSRITSPLIIKRQQNFETEIANNQAYDEIHDLQPKHSSSRKTNNDHVSGYPASKANNSHDLMQGNYYDQTRYDVNSSSSNHHLSDPQLIHINVDEYKKTIAPVSTSKNNSNKTRSSSPPFGHTSESIQQGIAQSAGILLELNKKPHHPKTSMKNNHRSHEQAVIDYYPSNGTESGEARSLSASSSSSDCSTSDSSTSNKCQNENEKTNIPYQKLTNDEDDDELSVQTKKPATESSTLLNKNLSQSYGTQSTNERSKYLANNGYNSHGSSITTKSSSDNSGSIRTNSGSDNDDESDEEHYNNSTASNHSQSKSINKTTDGRYLYSNEQSSYQSGRSNASRSEQIGNNDEHHLQVPRLKQPPNDDPNGNNSLTKLNSSTDHPTLPYTSKWPLQPSSVNQTNTLSSSSSSSSSHPNRNLLDRQEQQQHHSNSSRTNSRQHQIRTSKKRKQSQQQETIRTELIPGHRGDLDVDELVSFIDGNPPKQRQNSATSHSTDTHKPKLNSFNDSNSNKSASRKKSRKSIRALQQSTADDHENQVTDYLPFSEQHIEPKSSIDDDNSAKHSIVDITNQPSEQQSTSPTINHTENTHPLNTVHANTMKTTNGKTFLPDWFEQTQNASLQNDDGKNSYLLSSALINNSNSEPISEPFVTVTHRRRLTKERRQDNYALPVRSSRFPPAAPVSSNSNDKRPIPHNGIQRPPTHQNLSNHKATFPTITTEENNNRNNNNNSSTLSEPASHPTPPTSVTHPINNEQTLEKRQSSPRLSSQSSSSSLSSLVKRQSKPPPVVFLNKSIDIELNDVSFGFDLDSATLDHSSDEANIELPPTTNELDRETAHISSSPRANEPDQIVELATEKISRKSQQRNRGAQFYSGSDIRPHHHRPYPSQAISAQSSYIDPLLLFQYNQQRLANYSQQLAYMNFLRGQYISPQSQYVYLPATYTAAAAAAATTTASTTSETEGDEETHQTPSEQTVEPVVVYATHTGQLYYHPSATKKPYMDSEQTQPSSAPTVFTTTPTVYPQHYFYPPQAQHLIASHQTYFQPIPSPSLLAESESEQHDADGVDPHGDEHDESAKQTLQTRQPASSDIMSNALQLVYSQQRRNAQTDRFNLDDLTAYLAMKWTDTVDHYEQGDNRIVLVGEQP